MPEPQVQVKDISLSQLGRLWDMGLDIGGDAANRPTKPAEQVEWVYACLALIVRTCRDIPLVFSTPADDIVESGPLYDILLNNPDMSWQSFITDTIGYLALQGEVYWIFTKLDGLKPKQILVAGRDTCKPVVRNGLLVGYQLQVEGGKRIPLLLEDVWPVLDFNPYSKTKGLGPADAAKLSISSAYQAAHYSEQTLANGARIGVVIVIPAGVKLDADQRAAYKAEFQSAHAGARNAGLAFLAEGGGDIKPFTQTMVDLQMLDLRKLDAGAICAAFGVPGELVGLNPEAQYAHGPAQLRFVQNTVSPLLSFVAGHITDGLLRRYRFSKHAGVAVTRSASFCGPRFNLRRRADYRSAKYKALQSGAGLFAWFDLSQHPAMQEQLLKTAESVFKFTAAGVTLNDLIQAHDLPYEEQEWGNDWWIGMGQVPARFTLEAGLEGVTGPALPEGEEPPAEEPPQDEEPPADKSFSSPSAKEDDAKRRRVWQNWVVSWAGLEREYGVAIRKLFLRQQRQLIELLKKAMSPAKSAAKAAGDDIIARIVLDLTSEDKRLKAIHAAFFGKGAELGIRQALAEASGIIDKDKLQAVVDIAKRRPAVRRALITGAHKLTKVNVTTQAAVARQLKQGLDAGEGLVDLSARIRRTLGGNLNRAQSIARTQTAGAVGAGRHAGLAAAAVEKRGWLSSRDGSVRESHQQAERDYADGISLGLPFRVGDSLLMHPADPSGSPAEVINCRCCEIAIFAAGKAFGLAYYCNLKFYSYDDLLRDISDASHRE